METVDSVSKVQAVLDKAECLYDFAAIEQALDQMADAITAKLKDSNPILLCVMSGALIPMGHLVTRLKFPLQIDYVHATRYRGAMRGGDLHWLAEPRQPLAGRTVVVFDDIMDGGLTLEAIIDYCKQASAHAVYSAVMVNKKRTREPGVTIEPDFSGLITEDRYLFGFGLDHEEYLRNLPGIYALEDDSQ